MKPRMHPAIALVVAALTAPAAWAQLHDDANPAGSDPPPGTAFVDEPTASASKTEGPDGELGKALVDQMNGDPSLKGSKITVQPEDGKVTLSGVTVTKDQAKKAGQIAADKVGVENVTNAIRNSDV